VKTEVSIDSVMSIEMHFSSVGKEFISSINLLCIDIVCITSCSVKCDSCFIFEWQIFLTDKEITSVNKNVLASQFTISSINERECTLNNELPAYWLLTRAIVSDMSVSWNKDVFTFSWTFTIWPF